MKPLVLIQTRLEPPLAAAVAEVARRHRGSVAQWLRQHLQIAHDRALGLPIPPGFPTLEQEFAALAVVPDNPRTKPKTRP